MEKFNRQIIRLFLGFAFIIAVLESVIDSIFDDFIFERVENDILWMKMMTGIYILLSLAIFVIFAFSFSKAVNRKIAEESKKQLKERNLLYANITHDLKTPITSILGFASALKDGRVEPEQMEAVYDTIYEKSKRTDELINQLFYYTRLENDDYRLNYGNYDICAVVRSAVAGVYDKFEEKQMRLEIDIPDERIICRMDITEFSRVMNNLLVNAYTHNKEHTRVRISVAAEADLVKIMVADDGRMIEPSIREHIFEPFICGDESRQSNHGSGLGLAIASRIVKRHGGRIDILDHPGDYQKAFVVEMKCQNIVTTGGT